MYYFNKTIGCNSKKNPDVIEPGVVGAKFTKAKPKPKGPPSSPSHI